MTEQILPLEPFDGQEFIDAFRIKWVYNIEDGTWNKTGVVLDIPVARSPSNPLGPTNGLFSAKDKILLDNLPEKAGGFGLILKPGYYLTQEDGADSILTGNIKFTSETISFNCTTAVDQTPTIKLGLTSNFVQSYKLEIKGPKGLKGDKGKKGLPGRPGTGDGPVGDPGKDGNDALVHHTLSGIEYIELDAIYDTAVVGLKLDQENAILEVTKAKMDTPSSDKPATQVACSPVLRDVEFLSSGLDEWQLIGAQPDEPTVDLNVIRLPKGWNSQAGAAPIIPVKLSDLTQSIIDHYKAEADKIVENWDKLLREWVVGRDEAARAVLFDLAAQVAECQFSLPLEFCLGLSKQTGSTIYGDKSVLAMVFSDTAQSHYWPTSLVYKDEVAALNEVTKSIKKFGGATINVGTWPAYNGIIDIVPKYPDNTVPDKFTSYFVNGGALRYRIERSGATGAQIMTIYNTAVSQTLVNPDVVVILINNTGTMTTATVQPAMDDFKTLLRAANPNVTIVTREFKTMNWVAELTLELQGR